MNEKEIDKYFELDDKDKNILEKIRIKELSHKRHPTKLGDVGDEELFDIDIGDEIL